MNHSVLSMIIAISSIWGKNKYRQINTFYSIINLISIQSYSTYCNI